MPTEASELVRLDRNELDLIYKFRRCNPARQDVLQYIAEELSTQTKAAPPDNIVFLAGRTKTS
jgi:ribosomal protein S24E